MISASLDQSIASVQYRADGAPRFRLTYRQGHPAWSRLVEQEQNGGVLAELRVFLDAHLEPRDALLDLAPGTGFLALGAATAPAGSIRVAAMVETSEEARLLDLDARRAGVRVTASLREDILIEGLLSWCEREAEGAARTHIHLDATEAGKLLPALSALSLNVTAVLIDTSSFTLAQWAALHHALLSQDYQPFMLAEQRGAAALFQAGRDVVPVSVIAMREGTVPEHAPASRRMRTATVTIDAKRVAATQLSPLMISYAQNFEDVMLRRALQGVVRGTYIDVGANDSKNDSVTKWFYDSGWSGINIEPHDECFADLQRERPRDDNLKIAIADVEGEAQFCFVHESGLSSLDLGAASIAAKHGLQSQLGAVVVRTLDSVLAEHPLPEIHFLKVDVEGSEAKVIASIDLSRHRPWIILVEATEPVSTAPTWQCFESLIVERGYQRVHFDGLNTWYVRDESIALAEHFRLPPNVFDMFVGWKEHAWNLSQEDLPA